MRNPASASSPVLPMGIYDRDYYRDSTGGWFDNWGGRQGTIWIIALCVGAFIAQILSREQVTEWGVFYLPAIEQGQVWRIITAHFLHGGFFHILINMFILYWVGTELEAIYGTIEFVLFYLTTALLISLGKVALGLAGVAGEAVPSLGASGPIMAAFLLYACHYPYRRILLFFILPVPVWAAAVGMVLIDLYGFLGQKQTGIGYSAHLLGAAFGLAYYRYGIRITNWIPRWPSRLTRRAPRLRVYEPRRDEAVVGSAGPRAASSGADRSVDEQLEAKLDHVLEKVSRYGRDSLTPDEQEILKRASEIYKRRRGV